MQIIAQEICLAILLMNNRKNFVWLILTVSAIPIISRPDITHGKACICIDDGFYKQGKQQRIGNRYGCTCS